MEPERTCGCSPPEIAVQREVKKDGPRKGKLFWCCPKPMGEGCKYFVWDDPEMQKKSPFEKAPKVDHTAQLDRIETLVQHIYKALTDGAAAETPGAKKPRLGGK